MPTQRPVLNVALDEETYEALQDYCDREGVTGAALVEAFTGLSQASIRTLKRRACRDSLWTLGPSPPNEGDDAETIVMGRHRR